MTGASDKALIEVCSREARCLITLDLDFANPLVFKPSDYAGIAVLRASMQVSAAGLDDLIRTLIGALTLSTIVGGLWIVEPGRVREYQPSSE